MEKSSSPTSTSEKDLSRLFTPEILARQSPFGLAKMAAESLIGEALQCPPHLHHLHRVLMGVWDGSVKRLAVMMPPGHGKSFLTSKIFPAWSYLKNPNLRILLTAHDAEYSEQLSGDAKKVVHQFGDQVFGKSVDRRRDSSSHWTLRGGAGYVMARGVGGGIMGQRPHLIICDDLIKNDEAVRTLGRRDNMWSWYQTSCHTRLEPNGAIIHVLTRWDQDDYMGRLLDLERDKWTVVSMPAIAEENDILGRAPGEALWPERYPVEHLEGTRKLLESYGANWWAALYQQRPAPASGTLFNKSSFRYYWVESGEFVLCTGFSDGKAVLKRVPVDSCWVFLTADLAISTKDNADYTVFSVWAVTKDNELILLDVVRARMEGPKQLDMLKSLNRREPIVVNVIESNQYQLSLVQAAAREGLAAEGVRTSRDKFSRAQAPAARIESGYVYFRRNAPWLAAFEAELLAFRSGCDHDDQVDTLTLAVEKILGAGGFMGGGGLCILDIEKRRRKQRVIEAGVYPWERD